MWFILDGGKDLEAAKDIKKNLNLEPKNEIDFTENMIDVKPNVEMDITGDSSNVKPSVPVGSFDNVASINNDLKPNLNSVDGNVEWNFYHL